MTECQAEPEHGLDDVERDYYARAGCSLCEQAEDRAAIREAANLMDPNSSWFRTHAAAIARATGVKR